MQDTLLERRLTGLRLLPTSVVRQRFKTHFTRAVERQRKEFWAQCTAKGLRPETARHVADRMVQKWARGQVNAMVADHPAMRSDAGRAMARLQLRGIGC